MDTNKKQKLRTLVLEQLKKGKNLVILGWKASNHSALTRQLMAQGTVKFIDASEKQGRITVADNSIVLHTRFVSHSQIEQLKKAGIAFHPHPVTIGVIREILDSCKTELITAPVKVSDAEAAQAAPPVVTQDLSVLEAQMNAAAESPDVYDQFAHIFAKEAAKHPEAMVGSRTLGGILREIGIDMRPPDLVEKDYIVPFTQPGKKKIGWYTAGPELQQRLQKGTEAEPSDPIEKAQWLLSREPLYQAQLAEAERVVAHWQQRLARVEAARAILNQLRDI